MTADSSYLAPDVPTRGSDRQTSAWDIRNAPKNYLWLLIFQIGGSFFAFAAVWVLTQRIGKTGYGAVVAVIAGSQIAQIFINWTTVAVVRYGVDEFIETGGIARAFWSRFIILAINLGLVLATAWMWFPYLAEPLNLSPQMFWLLLFHVVVTVLWVHVQMGMQAAKMLRAQGALQMVERIMIFAGVIALSVFGLVEVRAAVLCYIAGPALMIPAGIFSVRRVVFRRFSVDHAFFRRVLLYSLPLLPYWFVGYLTGNYVDALFVSKYLSTAELGVYAIATQINGIVMQVPTLANTILLPLFLTQQAESGSERSFFFFKHVLPGLVLFWGLLCAFLAVAGNLAIPVVFNLDFQGAVLPLWLLLAASAFWIPVAVGYAAYANSISATYISLVASIFSAAVNIAGNIYLIPRYGIAGSAWATLMAYAVSVLVFAMLLRRLTAMPLSWTLLAFVPSIAGAVVITYAGRPFWALAACGVVTIIVGLTKLESLRQVYAFAMSMRRSAS